MTAQSERRGATLETAEPSSTRELLADIAWSYSRRSTLEQCPRRYYYEYFGANKRTAKSEPAKDELHALKAIQNRHERAGTILHLVIATCLRRVHKGERPDTDGLIRWGTQIFRTDRTYSARYPDGGGPTAQSAYPPVLLLEYHMRRPDADTTCREAEERLVVALQSFSTNERFREFRDGAAFPNALVERPFQVSGLPCKVSGKLDLAYSRLDGQTTVVDWKSGVEDGSGDDSLQLAIYALWAVEHFGCSPEVLHVCKAHLSSGEIVEFRSDRSVLAAARARIVQDAERMVELHSYGLSATGTAFTPCLRPGVCSLCNFASVCPEWKETGLA